MGPAYFENALYPLQDRTLALLEGLETGFYLSGGTAASRIYLHHRYSDDLDFFVNDRPEFPLWVDRAIHRLAAEYPLQITVRDERFARILVGGNGVLLKIEFINDVPSRVGTIRAVDGFGRVTALRSLGESLVIPDSSD